VLLYSSQVMFVLIGRPQIEMEISIQKTASQIQNDVRVSI